ncbi:DHH family phosphoesterase [Methanocaldococcus indicus]|uniref:DHH family phosphoesterase n=1 Tax=Methanocaldococcus indicus TaxID=213231 RepID=UPI003C6D16F3
MELLEFLKRDEILFLCHHNADPDAVGSCIALKYLAKYLNPKSNVRVVADSINKVSKNILREISDNIDIEVYPKLPSTVFVVDTASTSQLKVNVDELKKRDVVLIDHHKPSDLYDIAKLKIVDENSPSTSEIVAKIFKDLNIYPPKNVRLALLCGIVYDTKHLKLAKPETFSIISYLVKDISFNKVIYLLTNEGDEGKKIANLKACKRMILKEYKDIVIALSHVSSYEASAAKTLVSIGADVAFVVAVRKKEKEIRVSARCRKSISKKVHLGRLMEKIAKELNGSGSGHSEAAGLNAPLPEGKDKNKIIKEVLNLCYKKFIEELENG